MPLKDEFEKDILLLIKRSQDIGYNPTIIQQMIQSAHPVDVAKRLVTVSEFQHGIREMKKRNHLDLTIENLMLQEKYLSLFSQDELDAARWRLANVRKS